jgi:hypothetical protein
MPPSAAERVAAAKAAHLKLHEEGESPRKKGEPVIKHDLVCVHTARDHVFHGDDVARVQAALASGADRLAAALHDGSTATDRRRAALAEEYAAKRPAADGTFAIDSRDWNDVFHTIRDELLALVPPLAVSITG